MSRKIRLILVLLVLFACVDLCATRQQLSDTWSSFGNVPRGHAAVLELLSELDLARGRNLSAPSRFERDETIWWIEPERVCDARIAEGGEVDILDPDAVRWPVADWIEGGGTAVVMLEPPGPGKVLCDAIAGVTLPARPASEARRVTGSVLPAPRVLELDTLHAFDGALDWQVAAEVGELPFVLERELGEGRLVVVADAGFVRNEALDAADAALLGVDLARGFGAPRIDEVEHGIVEETNLVAYLAGSAAAPVFVGLALLGALVAWRGNALPPRRVAELDAEAPTLGRFVESMAALYERTGDHARVFDRYRELTAARLRRHFGLPAGVSLTGLAERVERDGRSANVLRDPPPVSSAAELRSAVKRLDQLVQEVMR